MGKMEDKLLPLIMDYKMDKDEAKAWKIAILYMQLAQKYFPDYNHYRIGKGDPRKTSLFKHCYKLVRETATLLQDYEYRMYISAQFQILKNIVTDGNHALIGPNCLVGAKAWKRWLVWKKRFEQTAKNDVETATTKSSEGKVYEELRDTKKYLAGKFSELTRKNVIDILNNRTLFRWCALGKVSPFYIVLSPVVQTWVNETGADLLEAFNLDLSYYRASVTKDVETFFKTEFAYEF